jgi:thioredoxin 2
MTDTATKRLAVIPCHSCGRLNRVDLLRADELARCGSCRASLVLDEPVALTDATFDTVVGASMVPVIVDFYADWCGPCKQMAPVFAGLARRLRGQVLVAKVDTDRSPAVSARFGIRSIPTIAVLRDGREVARQVGAVPMGALEELVRKSAMS